MHKDILVSELKAAEEERQNSAEEVLKKTALGSSSGSAASLSGKGGSTFGEKSSAGTSADALDKKEFALDNSMGESSKSNRSASTRSGRGGDNSNPSTSGGRKTGSINVLTGTALPMGGEASSSREEEESDEAPLVPSDLVATLIVMEFCDFGCVRRALHFSHAYDLEDGTRDAIALLRTLHDVALGLDYLHNAAGVVHGDLKPANVLLTTAGNTKRGWIAKLADFGVARAVEEGMVQQPSTVTARAEGGTNAFISPERITTGRLIPASDVYAFGILMWEGWTGLTPYSDQQISG